VWIEKPMPRIEANISNNRKPTIILPDSYANISRPLFIPISIQSQGLLKRRWVYHTIFWVIYYLFVCLYQVRGGVYILLTGPLLVQIAIIYFNIYILVPRLLFKKKYVQYALSILLMGAVATIMTLLIHKLYAELGSNAYKSMLTFNGKRMAVDFMDFIYLLSMATGIKFVKDWIVNQQLMQEKEKQYLETELNFLKSQIQPHFFFNTLNNLYSLTLKKSDLAPEIVLKLSELMSYMLYDSNAPLVPLTKEIAYLQNYLDVEQLRFGQRLSVSFDIEGPMEEVNIPPMILILFIENSFKHGVKNTISRIYIDISLKVEKGFLFFHIKNPLPDAGLSSENPGIGLKNGRRRLDLLYGKDYSLDVLVKDRTFLVSLKIPVC
jgi:two-component system, LytTR family, sensor kinase